VYRTWRSMAAQSEAAGPGRDLYAWPYDVPNCSSDLFKTEQDDPIVRRDDLRLRKRQMAHEHNRIHSSQYLQDLRPMSAAVPQGLARCTWFELALVAASGWKHA
jgi:hypothetical protein